MSPMPYDPLKRAEEVRKAVARTKGGLEERLYYRFRGGKWYGGVASADVIGCNLSCKFCWAWYFRDNVRKGSWHNHVEAGEKLVSIANRGGYEYVRLTGGEPTIAWSHLTKLINYVTSRGYRFIVETNGILIGACEKLAEELSRYRRILVRVSFKGVTPQEFSFLTGADESSWYLQLNALRNLLKSGLKPIENFYAAAMIGWSLDEDIEKFKQQLYDIHPDLIEVDWEYVIMYNHVAKYIKMTGLPKPKRLVYPDSIPSEMI